MKKCILLTIVASLVLGFLAGCDRSERDWERASTTNTVAAYEEYLHRHPESKFSNEAMSRLEELSRPADWRKAQAANTIPAYEEFLRKHPQGEYADQARSALNELHLPRDWETARYLNTIEAYEEFLERHPKSEHSEEVLRLLKPLRQEENFEQLAAEEQALPIPRKHSHTLEQVIDMIHQRANLSRKFKGALENGEITKEQYETLIKRNLKHGFGEA